MARPRQQEPLARVSKQGLISLNSRAAYLLLDAAWCWTGTRRKVQAFVRDEELVLIPTIDRRSSYAVQIYLDLNIVCFKSQRVAAEINRKYIKIKIEY